MSYPNIRTAEQTDKEKAIQTIVLGFSADPVTRWAWPGAEQYLSAMPKFVEAFGGRAFESGTAYIIEDGKAAALWLPPGVDPDGEKMGEIFQETAHAGIQDDFPELIAGMEKYHPHDQPCWYLPLIAADPTYLNQGLGSALMKHALKRCDEEGVIAYLESSNPRNISLYERHGFEIIGEIQSGSSPTLHPMLRTPKSSR